jgi:hypothetical protein
MFIESGIVIFFGLLFLSWKLNIKTKLKILGYPFATDLVVSTIAYALHWGTFTGVMAAAVAGLMTSGFTSAARYAIGYIDPKSKKYVVGKIWRVNYDR